MVSCCDLKACGTHRPTYFPDKESAIVAIRDSWGQTVSLKGGGAATFHAHPKGKPDFYVAEGWFFSRQQRSGWMVRIKKHTPEGEEN